MYGHQDTLSRPLTFMEKLNCQMDLMAKSTAIEHIEGTDNTISHTTSMGYGSITFKNILITSKIQSSLYSNIVHDDLCRLLSKKFNINIDLLYTVLGRSLQPQEKSLLSLHVFISKWPSGDTSTRRVMMRRKQRIYSFCPCCQEQDEYLLHILTFPAISTQLVRKDLLDKFETWIKKMKTHPDITSFFIKGISKWFENQEYSWTETSSLFTNDDIINQAFQSQISLGWFPTLCGLTFFPPYYNTTNILQKYRVKEIFTPLGYRSYKTTMKHNTTNMET